MARTLKESKMEDIFGLTTPLALSELEFFSPLASPAIEDSLFDDVYKELVGIKGETDNVGVSPESLSAGELLDELDLKGGDGFGETGWLTDKIDFNSLDAAVTATEIKDLTELNSNLKFETIDNTLRTFVLALPEESLESCNVLMTSDTIGPASPEQNVPDFAPLSPESSIMSPMSTSTDDSGISFASLDNDVTVAELLLSCGATALAVDQTQSPAVVEDSETMSSLTQQTNQTSNDGVRTTQKPYAKSKTVSYTVKPKVKTPHQKMRKREQNKDAATRYRVKKRGEQEELNSQCTDLEKVNRDLKDQVNSLSKEIDYLKNLMLEVYKTRLQKQQLGVSI